jgi:NAD(P)-dependent dehydrogenase (short-subunit alcohol dehydrogenase family)
LASDSLPRSPKPAPTSPSAPAERTASKRHAPSSKTPDAARSLYAPTSRTPTTAQPSSRRLPALKETPEQFRSVIEVNLNGCFWMAQACARVMLPGSSIVNIASVLGLTTTGLPQAAYSSSKAGLIGLTRDLAQQWAARKGIRVNALAPGFFASEMSDSMDRHHVETQILPRVLAGRLGLHAELAAALIFLASDAGSYVTGITLPVDGGVLTT